MRFSREAAGGDGILVRLSPAEGLLVRCRGVSDTVGSKAIGLTPAGRMGVLDIPNGRWAVSSLGFQGSYKGL